MNYSDLANLLFPDVTQTIEDIAIQYPPRQNSPIPLAFTTWDLEQEGETSQVVSRMAPSPTGFFHIGNLFTAIVNERIAHQDNGIFFWRVEDTDQARKVDGSMEAVIENMKTLWLQIDEGPLGIDFADQWNYGPYIQSKRVHLYRIFAKHLVAQGLAYPCWMSSEQMESIREEQMKTKKIPGIYGSYALWRNKSIEEYADQFKKDQTCTLRFRSHGDLKARVVFEDINRWKVSMADNYNDMVILKWWLHGTTYHLAHIVDDFLMRTTHVTRGEEWLTSVPFHLQLFNAFGITPPLYCHLPLILKLDNGKKRKISKRSDPEFNIRYLYEAGYSPEGLTMFVLTLIDSGYEERQKANLDKSYKEHKIDLHRMNSSGALWDTDKLNHINNIYLSKISNQQLFDETLAWATTYRPEFASLIKSDPDYALAAMSIERHTDLDPKRFNTYADVESQVRFFFDEVYESLLAGKPQTPEMFTPKLASQFITIYQEQLDLTISKEERFAQLKEIGKILWFAPSNGEFKEWWYIGKIGDLAMRLRIQLAASTQTPDLYSMMQVMGKNRTLERIKKWKIN
jgi:glutamyl-tRNA synthetase